MVSSIAPAFLYISTVDLELLLQLLLVHCAEVDLIRPSRSPAPAAKVEWVEEEKDPLAGGAVVDDADVEDVGMTWLHVCVLSRSYLHCYIL